MTTIEKLIKENHARFLGFVQSKVKSAEAAEDILQFAYKRSLEKSGALKKEESLVAWFYRILRNAIIDYYRSHGSEKERFEAIEESHDWPVQPDFKIEKAICKCMAGIIPTLKPEYADAIKEIELNDQSVKDFAKKKGLTSNNSNVQIHRARQSLKKKLIQTCGSCSDHGCLDCNCKHV